MNCFLITNEGFEGKILLSLRISFVRDVSNCLNHCKLFICYEESNFLRAMDDIKFNFTSFPI